MGECIYNHVTRRDVVSFKVQVVPGACSTIISRAACLPATQRRAHTSVPLQRL